MPHDQSSIGLAVLNAAPGETILVSPGIYKENVVAALDDLTFTGSAGAVLDGNVAGAEGDTLTITGNGTVVQGLTFRNGATQLSITGADARVTRCAFLDASAGLSIAGTGAVVSSCRFVGHQGISFQTAAGSHGLQVLRNQVRQAGGTGMVLDGDGAILSGNQFLGVDDARALQVTGNQALVTGNRFTTTGASPSNASNGEGASSSSSTVATKRPLFATRSQ